VHSEERAISLSLKLLLLLLLCSTNQGPLVIRFRPETQFDPCISSVTRSIMIITSNSPGKGSGIPTQLLDVLLHTIAMSGLSRVRIELSQLLVIPFLAHHPRPEGAYGLGSSRKPQLQYWLDGKALHRLSPNT
jgi:hypothetical protein